MCVLPDRRARCGLGVGGFPVPGPGFSVSGLGFRVPGSG